ncbi:MAG: hypothetical protein ACJASM_002983 [Salibacteraceae bacterium]|jgi:hypothetical protein
MSDQNSKSNLENTATPEKVIDGTLSKGNREIITDCYVPNDITGEQNKFKYKIFLRLNAKDKKFTKISFEHCIFDNCYLNNCVFDSCDFTGCKFQGSNFHQTAFRGCDFKFATFERSQFDDDILISEAPREENLRMHFARSLRMNYQQTGDAKAVNKSISVELEATSIYLYKSWNSGETYYKEKYNGVLNGVVQFLKWLEFWILNFIWGNGESIVKFLRTILITLIMISIYDTNTNGNPLNIGFLWSSFQKSPAIFLGILSPDNFTLVMLSLVTGIKLVSLALLTTLLVKRFSRR